jgi:hypothetical protein
MWIDRIILEDKPEEMNKKLYDLCKSGSAEVVKVDLQMQEGGIFMLIAHVRVWDES